MNIVLTISMNTMENKYLYICKQYRLYFLPSERFLKKVPFELRHLWGCVFFIQRILRYGRLYHACAKQPGNKRREEPD